MPIAVGIDLGTARSAVAVYMNEEITVIPQDNGNDFIPSVVSFASNEILVGDPAVEQAIVNPKNTIFGIKRVIGRRFDDAQLQKFLEGVSYDVKNVDGNPKITVNYKDEERLYDPENISAMILKKLKMRAEIFLGIKLELAVITVPTFFSDSQRQATKDAGSLAGLNVLQILNEPTAVAIAYGLDKISKDEKYILVFDFGSGMFDASILKVKQSVFETLASVGNTSLGGFDIDSALIDYCADLFYKEHGKNVKTDPVAAKRLQVACSHAKDILSRRNETVIIVDALMGGIDFHLNISRSKFEKLCEPIFNKTIELLHQVVVNSGVKKKDIDDVILVGGSTQIPKIRQLVSDYFDGRYISKSFNPSLAVVFGAALRAAFLSGYKDRKITNMLCVDVTSLSIGIETSGGLMTIVIEKGTPIPTTATYTITTHTDKQAAVLIRVFEGERALTCNNHFLGTLELFGLPPLPQGLPRIEVTFEIDKNGILTVSASERTGMEFDTISICLEKGRLSKLDISRLLEEAEEFEEKDESIRDRVRRKNALENYIHSVCKAAFSDTRNRLSNREKLEINKICNEVREWLEENPSADDSAITEKRNATIKLLQSYASRLDVSVIPKHDPGYVRKGSILEKIGWLEVDKYEP